MFIGIFHFVIVYLVPFVMSLNRVGEYPSNEKGMKSMLIYWMLNVILITLEQSIKIRQSIFINPAIITS